MFIQSDKVINDDGTITYSVYELDVSNKPIHPPYTATVPLGSDQDTIFAALKAEYNTYQAKVTTKHNTPDLDMTALTSYLSK